MLISIQNEREWASFCRVVLDDGSLPETPGYQNNSARVANRAEVDGYVGRVFATMNRERAAAKLREAGTAFGFVNSVADLASHPALRRVTVGTSNGPASIIAPPAIRDGEAPVLGPVPAIGEHSEAIRREFA